MLQHGYLAELGRASEEFSLMLLLMAYWPICKAVKEQSLG